MEEITRLLEEELKQEIEKLSDLTPGSEEHSVAVDSVNKLYKLKLEEVKSQWEYTEKFERREMEEQHLLNEEAIKKAQLEVEANRIAGEERFKDMQLKEQKLERYFRYGAEALLTVGGWVFFNCQTNKGYRFEQTGTILSKTFQSVLRNIKPGRR